MSSPTRQVVSESWDILGSVAVTDDRRGRALPDFQTAHGSVMLAEDSEGTRHVLVPIAADDLVRPDTGSRGVQLVRSSFIDQGVRRHFIDIRCPDPRLYRLFDQVAASMLDAVCSAGDVPPGEVCRQVLESWRALLRRAAKPLEPAALRGLFGELWYLAQLCKDSPSAVDHWCGPDGQPQDFISAHGAFEIKTTIRVPARRVSISGVDQLDDAAHECLTLVVISVAEEPGGQTIPELIETIVSLGGDRVRVLDQLAKAGLSEQDFPEAAKLSLRVASAIGYRVEDGFPRLTPRSFSPALSAGIQKVSYEVDLAAASDFAVSDAELRARQQRFLTGAGP